MDGALPARHAERCCILNCLAARVSEKNIRTGLRGSYSVGSTTSMTREADRLFHVARRGGWLQVIDTRATRFSIDLGTGSVTGTESGGRRHDHRCHSGQRDSRARSGFDRVEQDMRSPWCGTRTTSAAGSSPRGSESPHGSRALSALGRCARHLPDAAAIVATPAQRHQRHRRHHGEVLRCRASIRVRRRWRARSPARSDERAAGAVRRADRYRRTRRPATGVRNAWRRRRAAV